MEEEQGRELHAVTEIDGRWVEVSLVRLLVDDVLENLTRADLEYLGPALRERARHEDEIQAELDAEDPSYTESPRTAGRALRAIADYVDVVLSERKRTGA